MYIRLPDRYTSRMYTTNVVAKKFKQFFLRISVVAGLDKPTSNGIDMGFKISGHRGLRKVLFQ